MEEWLANEISTSKIQNNESLGGTSSKKSFKKKDRRPGLNQKT